VLDRLVAADVDVEFVGGESQEHEDGRDPLQEVRDGLLDLALVGIRALRGSAADGLTTVAVLPRESYRDVLVVQTATASNLNDLPAGMRVGVVGRRREAFLRAHRPDLEPVQSCLEDLISPEAAMDASILSALEARDAGLVDKITESLDPKSWLPEPGQGVLALVARHPIAEATALDHLPTRTAMRAELALLDALEAEADAALGSLAQPSGGSIRLWAAAVSGDGQRLVRSDLTGPLDEPEALGGAVAKQLADRGIHLVMPARV
jgi:hydroxymethylbilane synthase